MAEISKQLLDVARRMDTGSSSSREAARLQLSQMGPMAVARLVAELQRTPGTQKKFSMLLIATRIVLLPVLVIGFVLAILLTLAAPRMYALGGYPEDWGCLGDVFTGWNVREEYEDRLHNRQWNEIARALSQLDDIRVAGPLAEALAVADVATQTMLRAALLRLLPRFTTAQALQLTPTQRQSLYRHLKAGIPQEHGPDQRLSLTIAKFLVRTEDVQTIPLMATVAQSAASLPMRQEAREGLTYLEEVLTRQRISQSLLRGASATATPANILLRPAQYGTVSEPVQLLRATHVEETI